MARTPTVELMLQGQPLSSFGAPSCRDERYLEAGIGRTPRKQAELGLPVGRW